MVSNNSYLNQVIVTILNDNDNYDDNHQTAPSSVLVPQPQKPAWLHHSEPGWPHETPSQAGTRWILLNSDHSLHHWLNDNLMVENGWSWLMMAIDGWWWLCNYGYSWLVLENQISRWLVRRHHFQQCWMTINNNHRQQGILTITINWVHLMFCPRMDGFTRRNYHCRRLGHSWRYPMQVTTMSSNQWIDRWKYTHQQQITMQIHTT